MPHRAPGLRCTGAGLTKGLTTESRAHLSPTPGPTPLRVSTVSSTRRSRPFPLVPETERRVGTLAQPPTGFRDLRRPAGRWLPSTVSRPDRPGWQARRQESAADWKQTSLAIGTETPARGRGRLKSLQQEQESASASCALGTRPQGRQADPDPQGAQPRAARLQPPALTRVGDGMRHTTDRRSWLARDLCWNAAMHQRPVPDATHVARTPAVRDIAGDAAGTPVGINRFECQIANNGRG